jgi:hypothetical protein
MNRPAEPPYDGKACPMCPFNIRGLSAVVHNIAWRLDPTAGVSLCKIVDKFHDLKTAVAGVTIADDAPEQIKELYAAALTACQSKTIDELRTHAAGLKAASDAIQPLVDAHFENRLHSHGEIR